MANPPQKYIVIDGVSYDTETGEALSDTSAQSNTKPKHKAGRPDVLDLRSTERIIEPRRAQIDQRQTSLAELEPLEAAPPVVPIIPIKPKHVRAPKLQSKVAAARATRKVKKQQAATRAATAKPSRISLKTKPPKLATHSKPLDLDYFSFVFLRAFWPTRYFILWQLSLLRAIVSPQTWILLSLPVILVQLRVLRHMTTNEALQSAKDFVSPDHYSALVLTLGISLSLFLLGIFLRSIIANTGISLRLREIDKRSQTVSGALRNAVSSLLAQSLNYLIHLSIIVLVTLVALWLANKLYHTGNVWLMESKYQVLVALVITWGVVLVMLYGKHWLQVCLLARSNKQRHLQVQSLGLILMAPLRTIVSATLALGSTIGAYALIIYLDWQVTEYFVTHTGSPTALVLIGVAIFTVVLLTTVQYIQQNLWARHYYLVANESDDRVELLYMEPERPASLVPLFVAIGLAGAVIGVYICIVTFQAARIKGLLADLHAQVPSQIQFSVPIKK